MACVTKNGGEGVNENTSILVQKLVNILSHNCHVISDEIAWSFLNGRYDNEWYGCVQCSCETDEFFSDASTVFI